jgi:voltage-gated potassium channel
MRLRQRVYEILEVAASGDRASRVFDISIMALIALNVIALVLETVESVDARIGPFLDVFEIVSVLIFSAEYVLRIWSCTVDRKYGAPVRGRLRFARTPMAMIDLLAVLPFYLPFLGVDLRLIRSVRLFRLFRVAKLGRYSQALRTFGRVFANKKEELAVTLFVLFLLLLFASSAMYFAEHQDQPEVFSSIPAAMWWGVATLTTVGYGDVCPVTPIGKVIAAIIAIIGIGTFALPTGILGAGFVEEVQKRKKQPQTCPHCGKELDAQ